MNTDLSLRQDVERELLWEPIVRSQEIGVSVKDGVVTLMGNVENFAVQRAAERAAARVRGVRAIANQLEVNLPCAAGRSDADIAWSVANVLSWNSLVPRDQIRISVSKGRVTLDGFVDWRFQKTAAEDAVANLAGVAGITNLIRVEPPVPPDEMKAQIETALMRSAEVEEGKIIVEVARDCVTLWGTVDAFAERNAAEAAAWSAPGVRDVSNHITVEAGVALATVS
jgi:osmotically-inducible protein OsmY